MKSRRRLPMLTCVLPLLVSLLPIGPTGVNAAEKKAKGAADFLENVQTGDLRFLSIGQMNFGPKGLLLVANPRAAAVVAIDTGDLGPVKKLKKRIDNVDDLVASAMGLLEMETVGVGDGRALKSWTHCLVPFTWTN